MIAASILAAMGAMVFGSFRQAWTQKEEIEKVSERYAAVRAALDRIALETSEAFLSEHYDKKRYPPQDPERIPTYFVGKDEGRRDELEFTCLCNERMEADSKTSDQAAVRYWVDRDPDDPRVESLLRRVNPVLDEDVRRRGVKAVLCRDVKAFEVEYWDTIKNEWTDEWDTSRTEHLRVLPERIRFSLTIKDETGNERKFSTESQLMLPRSLDF